MSDTASTRSDGAAALPASPLQPEPQEWRRWLGFRSLRARIFAVNIVAVIVLAIMLLYLDTVRSRLLVERSNELGRQAITIAGFASDLPPEELTAALERKGYPRGTRIRLYATDGALLADNWRRPETPRFEVQDPAVQTLKRRSARWLDRALETVNGSGRPEDYREARLDTGRQWEEAVAALASANVETRVRRAEDGFFVLGAAAPVTAIGVVELTDSAADVTEILRAERLTSAWLLLGVAAITLSLSLFLANTIVRPIRMLGLAAHRVRLGRSREVVVPRLPERRDELGDLARALSDMSIALRLRIDATEAFAADVAHELKNPLASMRSAVDTLEAVKDPALRDRLLEVIRDDVARLDRLITDIADASRLDAELSRTRFEPLDAGALAADLVEAYRVSGLPPGVSIDYLPPAAGAAKVQGDPQRLAQVLRNLIDNAVSFSPKPGLVVVSADTRPGLVMLKVEDEGPGVPPENRADVFRRFYSERPAAEHFGRHSGLGLSIAGAIIEAHGGTIRVDDRVGGGAVFTVELPAG